MSKFFDDTMQGLLEAVAIEKGYIPVEMQDSNSQYKEKKEAFSKLEQFSDGRLTEPSDGIRYEWRKMIDEVKRLGRSLTEKEAEVFQVK